MTVKKIAPKDKEKKKRIGRLLDLGWVKVKGLVRIENC